MMREEPLVLPSAQQTFDTGRPIPTQGSKGSRQDPCCEPKKKKLHAAQN